MSKESSLRVLNQLIGGQSGARTEELLRVVGNDSEWFIHCPAFFNDALDIKWDNKRNAYTQSNCFAFQENDLLYNTPKAYEASWGDAIPYIKHAVQINSASPAGVGLRGIFERHVGSVSFTLLVKDSEDKLREESQFRCTQEDFIRFLICGPSALQ